MGDLVLKGSTSGQITVTPTAVAGTNTLTLPAKTGNIITSADSGTVTGTMLASATVTGSNIASATVTQSNLATNVAGNGPAFSVYLASTQSITANTFTKVTLTGSLFDTASSVSSSRFQPTVAGYYRIDATGCCNGSVSMSRQVWSFYKNGSEYHRFVDNYFSVAGNNIIASGTLLVYLNGSSDYIELYAYLSGSGLSFSYAAPQETCTLSGCLVRSA